MDNCKIKAVVMYPRSEMVLDYVLACDEPPKLIDVAREFKLSTEGVLEVCRQLKLGLLIKEARFERTEKDGCAIAFDYSTEGIFVVAEKYLDIVESDKAKTLTIPYGIFGIKDEYARNIALITWMSQLTEQERQRLSQDTQRFIESLQPFIDMFTNVCQQIVVTLAEWIEKNPELMAYLENVKDANR